MLLSAQLEHGQFSPITETWQRSHGNKKNDKWTESEAYFCEETVRNQLKEMKLLSRKTN